MLDGRLHLLQWWPVCGDPYHIGTASASKLRTGGVATELEPLSFLSLKHCIQQWHDILASSLTRPSCDKHKLIVTILTPAVTILTPNEWCQSVEALIAGTIVAILAT